MTSPASPPVLTADEKADRLLDAVECLSVDVSEMTALLRDLLSMAERYTDEDRYGRPL